MNADAGGGLYWSKAEVISINRNGKVGEEEIFKNKHVFYKYSDNTGWRIDTESADKMV